ncbi:MAG TPA: hypothetical protein VFQ61_15820 [Polyangiaceae bacterium]|nr:hypothetical protein [Polyangiaceae bacterium]
MSREDLRVLTPDALAALANRGLVKRAQKELDAGLAPTLEELPDGTVIGRFGDVETRLPQRTGLSDAPCNCGAAGICRHKLIVVLAYARVAAASADGKSPDANSPDTQARAPERIEAKSTDAETTSWSPGDFSDEELEHFLGARAWERARALFRKGYVAEVRRAMGPDHAPTALLPTCSVRFLVPRDLNYAHSDSGERAAEAVALAVWAFRAADVRDSHAKRLELEVRDALAENSTIADELSPALALAQELLLEGIIHSRNSMAGQFERVRQTLTAVRLIWPALILEDLEQELSAYHTRSARYSPASAAALISELHARARAVRRPNVLPAARILGTEVASETPLAHLRLSSLGARVRGDASQRLAEVVLADPDTATLLVMRKEYEIKAGQRAPLPSELGRKPFAPRTTLAAIATGQVVTASARRAANRLLVLGQGRVARTSVMPSNGDWSGLPEALRVRNTNQLAQELAERPPTLLRARVLADGVYVLEIAAVEGLSYAPGAQRLSARIVPHAGPSVRLVRSYDVAAPGALDELALALSAKTGPPRFVSGSVRHTASGLELEPIGIVTDRFHVPDLADPSSDPRLPIPGGVATGPNELANPISPITTALSLAANVLDDGVHHGLRRASPNFGGQLGERAAELRRTGLIGLAARFEALKYALAESQARGDTDSETTLTARWADAAIRLRLCEETGQS